MAQEIQEQKRSRSPQAPENIAARLKAIQLVYDACKTKSLIHDAHVYSQTGLTRIVHKLKEMGVVTVPDKKHPTALAWVSTKNFTEILNDMTLNKIQREKLEKLRKASATVQAPVTPASSDIVTLVNVQDQYNATTATKPVEAVANTHDTATLRKLKEVVAAGEAGFDTVLADRLRIMLEFIDRYGVVNTVTFMQDGLKGTFDSLKIPK